MDTRYQKVILTTMCLIKKSDEYLFLLRNKKDWPGLTLPGGHVEKKESIEDSLVREIREETGLKLKNFNLVDVFEWKREEGKYLAFLYFSDSFEGDLIASDEGDLIFLRKEELKKYQFSLDFDKILKKYKNYI